MTVGALSLLVSAEPSGTGDSQHANPMPRPVYRLLGAETPAVSTGHKDQAVFNLPLLPLPLTAVSFPLTVSRL